MQLGACQPQGRVDGSAVAALGLFLTTTGTAERCITVFIHIVIVFTAGSIACTATGFGSGYRSWVGVSRYTRAFCGVASGKYLTVSEMFQNTTYTHQSNGIKCVRMGWH